MNTKYEIMGTPLDSIHNVLLEILLEIDRVCKKNAIEYFLSGGTLLGAIRHNGFIPWDDDLDIWMTRKEYKKFKKCLKSDLNYEKFVYEDYFVNKYFPLGILKIKRRDTIFVEKAFEDLPINHMLYVDIFPLDHTNKFFFPIQCALLTKCQSIRMFLLDKNKKSYKMSKRILYSLFSLKFIRFLTEFFCRMLNIFGTKHYAQLCHRPKYWPLFSRADVSDLVLHLFENYLFPIPKNYESILTRCYKDFRKLPSVDKRTPSHDVVSCSIIFKNVETIGGHEG